MGKDVFAERVLTTPEGTSVTVQLRYSVATKPAKWSYTLGKGEENELPSSSHIDGIEVLQDVLGTLAKALSAVSEGWHFLGTPGTGLEILHPDPDMDALLVLLIDEEAFKQNCLIDAVCHVDDKVLEGVAEDFYKIAYLRQKIRYRIVALARADSDGALLHERTYPLETLLPVDDEVSTFVVVGSFVRKDTGNSVLLEVHAPRMVKTAQGMAWGCDYKFIGLDSEVQRRALGDDSMGALLLAFESIRIDFLQSATPVGFPDEFGKWDESSELGYAGFEVWPGSPDEQALFEHLTQTEILRNRLLFNEIKGAPISEIQQIREQLLVHLQGAERVRFEIHERLIQRELRLANNS